MTDTAADKGLDLTRRQQAFHLISFFVRRFSPYVAPLYCPTEPDAVALRMLWRQLAQVRAARAEESGATC